MSVLYDMNRNVLIDGNNLLHRAKAIFVDNSSQLFSSDSGYPTGLIYGSLKMLSTWLNEIDRPTRAVLFLDGKPTRRRNIDHTYKVKIDCGPPVGRDDRSISLSDGFVATNEVDVFAHILQLFGIDYIYHPNEEADDLIASFIKQNSNDLNIIISSDKDFFQILSDKVIAYRPGVDGNRFFDAEKAEEYMYEKYGANMSVSSVRMFKSLTGDKSDNINGIPRLRKKVIAKLCSADSVDALYETGLPGLSKLEKEKVESMRDVITTNYELVGLIQDIDVESMRHHIDPNPDMANKILSNDLQINLIDTFVFKFCHKYRVITSDSSVVIDSIPNSVFDDL